MRARNTMKASKQVVKGAFFDLNNVRLLLWNKDNGPGAATFKVLREQYSDQEVLRRYEEAVEFAMSKAVKPKYDAFGRPIQDEAYS